MKMWQLIHCICFICFHFAQSSTPTCSNLGYGRFCSLQLSPEIIKIVDDQLLVGTANEILVFQPGLQNVQSINLTSDSTSMQECRDDQLSTDPNDCNYNYIRIIEPLPGSENRIMVCGTHSFSPKCTIHQGNLLTNYSTLTTGTGNDGFSPYSNSDPIVAILSDNGRFFSATGFQLYPPSTIIGMSPDPLVPSTTFTVRSPRTNPLWLNKAEFLSVYEYGDYIYFFIVEQAYELFTLTDQNVKYARAIRICKTDDGNDMSNFLTFQKARMECTHGESGSIPFHYNDLKSTYKGESINGDPILYGVFNSHPNGPPGGAICKFSFVEALTSVFEDGQYRVQTGDNTWEQRASAPLSFSCPGSGEENQRPLQESKDLQLMYNSVTPTQDDPLLIADGEFLNRIVAETIMYGEKVQEIIYYTNQQGDIKQVITTDQSSYKHTIHKAETTSSIRELTLREKDNERSLYASTDGGILSIVRGQCSNYATCLSCFDSRDAYCAWDTATESCVNKLSHASSSTLIQSFSASEENITIQCGVRPEGSTPKPSICTSKPSTSSENNDQTTTMESDDGKDCSTSGPVTSGPDSQKIGTTSISVITGVTVGALIIGVLVGLLVGILFQRCFAGFKPSNSEAPKNGDGSSDAGGDMVVITPVNNNNNLHSNEIEKKKEIELAEGGGVVNSRYVQHVPPGSMVPMVGFKSSTLNPSVNYTTTTPPQVMNGTIGNTTHKHTNNSSKEMNHNHYHSPEAEEDNDSAFAEGDTVSPLKIFSATTPVYHGSLGRHKKREPNGISRMQVPRFKLPMGRTDSTTWLRQESVSSDISPLQSPISDV